MPSDRTEHTDPTGLIDHGDAAEGAETVRLRLLLDEHYPGWLAEDLVAEQIDAVALTADRPELRGADDRRVLEAAVAERRVVVTEDVNTFAVAAALVPRHVGIIYCLHSRFPRTRPGLSRMRKALVDLAGSLPAGLGEEPVVWWLADSYKAEAGGRP